NRWGRDETEWLEMIDAGYAFLVEVVSRQEFTDYSMLSREISIRTGHPAFDFDQPRDQGAVGDLLGEIVRRADSDFPQHDYMLSAAVIHKGGSDPGEGF